MLRGLKFPNIVVENVNRRVYIPFSKVYVPPTNVEAIFSHKDDGGFMRRREKRQYEISSRHIAVCASTYPYKRIGPIFLSSNEDSKSLDEHIILLSKKDIDKTVLFRPDIKKSYLSDTISSVTTGFLTQELENIKKRINTDECYFNNPTMSLKDDLIFLPYYEVTDNNNNIRYISAFDHVDKFRHNSSAIKTERANTATNSTQNNIDKKNNFSLKYILFLGSMASILYVIEPKSEFFGGLLPLACAYVLPYFLLKNTENVDARVNTDVNTETEKDDDYMEKNQEIIDNHSETSEMTDLVDEFNLKGLFKFNNFSGNDLNLACELFGLSMPFTKDQLKTSYMALIKKHHPDNPNNTDKESSNHTAQLINDSHKLLQEHCK